MSVKTPTYVNLESSSEEHQNEKTSSPPFRKKSLSPPHAPSKFTSSMSTHYTSSSSPSPSNLSPSPRVSRPPLGFLHLPPGFEQQLPPQPLFVNIKNNASQLKNTQHPPPNRGKQDFPNPSNNIFDFVHLNDMPHLHNMFFQFDYKFLNEGVSNHSAINRSWQLLSQCMQQQSNVLLRFEVLSEDYVDLNHAHESCKEMKACCKECKKEMGKLRTVYDYNVSAYDQLLKDYDGALNTKKGLNKRVKVLKEDKKELEDVNVK
uniref:Uncharacterized protein n=1 Tax=Tanacetum cinerariifolium TaxID=118510 RepID=A0A6L2LCI9_TANCI|nr:hypothetical protein [Tanacetum cinerariifolium]